MTSEREELIEILERFQNPVFDIALVADLIADELVKAGYRKVSADPDTVERVAEAIHATYCVFPGECDLLDMKAARAAINAIGGGDG